MNTQSPSAYVPDLAGAPARVARYFALSAPRANQQSLADEEVRQRFGIAQSVWDRYNGESVRVLSADLTALDFNRMLAAILGIEKSPASIADIKAAADRFADAAALNADGARDSSRTREALHPCFSPESGSIDAREAVCVALGLNAATATTADIVRVAVEFASESLENSEEVERRIGRNLVRQPAPDAPGLNDRERTAIEERYGVRETKALSAHEPQTQRASDEEVRRFFGISEETWRKYNG